MPDNSRWVKGSVASAWSLRRGCGWTGVPPSPVFPADAAGLRVSDGEVEDGDSADGCAPEDSGAGRMLALGEGVAFSTGSVLGFSHPLSALQETAKRSEYRRERGEVFMQTAPRFVHRR